MSGVKKAAPLTVSATELSPLMLACLADGQEVRLTVTGNSMCPFLRHRRDEVILVKPASVTAMRVGDVPLYRRRDGRLVLHRIVERDDGRRRRLYGERAAFPSNNPNGSLTYTMCGDAQTVLESPIYPDQIVAVAKAFVRKGKRWSCRSRAYRRRMWRWEKWRPLRAPLVWLYLFPSRVAGKLGRLFKKE